MARFLQTPKGMIADFFHFIGSLVQGLLTLAFVVFVLAVLGHLSRQSKSSGGDKISDPTQPLCFFWHGRYAHPLPGAR